MIDSNHFSKVMCLNRKRLEEINKGIQKRDKEVWWLVVDIKSCNVLEWIIAGNRDLKEN